MSIGNNNSYKMYDLVRYCSFAMEVLQGLVVLVGATIVHGGNDFRPDYEYYASADGWFKLHVVPDLWGDARIVCDFEGAVLASPINVEVRNVMQRIFNKSDQSISMVYTGVSNVIAKSLYHSIEGVPLSALPVSTRSMFPDDYSSGSHCTRLLPQGDLVAGSCGDVLPYICYKKKTTELRMTECGTVDTGYQLNPRTGHCYKFHKDPLLWWLAYWKCIAEGGQLAVINSVAEADVLKELFAKYPPSYIKGEYKDLIFLGFRESFIPNFWRTVNGQTLEEAGYANWAADEPNYEHIKYSGVMYRSGELGELEKEKLAPFVCEKHPNNIIPVPNNGQKV